MKSESQLYKKFSIGISFYRMSAEDWINVFSQYSQYINDVFFSPIESLDFQTRRNIYNYDTQNQEFLDSQLKTVLDAAKQKGIARKIVLNVPIFIDNEETLLRAYEKYKDNYNMEYVTTFLSCAKRIKEMDSTQKIICSYNQGITTHQELERILETDVFYSIVLGTNFLRDFNAFNLIHRYKQKVELLLNNGCMPNCKSFCRLPNIYCESNFADNLSRKDINYLYAECSTFPEEIHKHYLTSNLIDYFKLSTRPINYGGMVDMLSSYITGNSWSYIRSSVINYNLYGRLAHFHKHYGELQYAQILNYKKEIWENLNIV